jgi:hypothetical protein
MNAVSKVGFALGVLVLASQAFAQSSAQAQSDAASNAPAYGAMDQSQPKTRAQVYQELVQAQRDGEIKRLNATVYAHH